MTLPAHKGMELPLPLQVVDDNFHELGLGAAERHLSARVFSASEVVNPHYIHVGLHRPNGMSRQA